MPRSGGVYFTMNAEARAELPALILIHGAGGQGALWPYQLRRLPGFRVYSPDLPGHGNSILAAERSAAGYASRLWDWADSIGLQRAVLCGHSMGAAIAMEMALAAPQRAAGLVLTGAAAKFAVNPELMEKFAVPAWVDEGIKMVVRWSFSRGADEGLHKAYARQLQSCPAGVLNMDFKACADFNLGLRAKQLETPAAIISAEDDVMVTPRLSQALEDSLPKAALHSLTGAGHMLMLEKPAETAALVEKVAKGLISKD